MLLAQIIIISPFVTPYSTHNESPVINETISHFETSSVFLVRRDFLIWGMYFTTKKRGKYSNNKN